jgi:hypothetical protein
MRGRAYWNAQNETSHTSPDWKLHFSCHFDDLPSAWNILAALFLEMKCEIGMKATVISPEDWSEGQRGRELTIYIYNWHSSYKDYMQLGTETDPEFYMDQAYPSKLYNSPFWFSFLRTAEERLARAGVRSRGVADGDLPLPTCAYASLRNESFVQDPAKSSSEAGGMLVYPPNHCGWNAAGHVNPFLEVIFFLKALEPFIVALDQDSSMPGPER